MELAPDEDAIFSSMNTELFEINLKTTFTPTFTAFNSIVAEIIAAYSKFFTIEKILSPSMLNYYSSAMVWHRIIRLKQANHDPFTPTER